MKPYIVVRVDEQLADMVPPRSNRLVREQLVYASYEHGPRERPHDFDGTHPVYFADDEASADNLAALLATKKPGTNWVVAKSTSSFRCAATPVAKAVFTNEGLLPSN